MKEFVGTPEELEKTFSETPRLVIVSTRRSFAWASGLPIDPPVREFARFEAVNLNARGERQVVIVSGPGLAESDGK